MPKLLQSNSCIGEEKNKRKQTRTVKKNNHPTKNNNIRIIKDLKKNIKELKLTNKNIIKHLEQTTAEFFTEFLRETHRGPRCGYPFCPRPGVRPRSKGPESCDLWIFHGKTMGNAWENRKTHGKTG